MEDGERVVRAEEEALVDFRQAAKVQQHTKAVGVGQGRNVGVEVWIALHEVAQCREKLFIEDESVAAGMGGNDGGTFVKRSAKPVGIAEGLVLSDEGKLVADVTQERQPPLGESLVERFVAGISRIELLRVWEDLH